MKCIQSGTRIEHPYSFFTDTFHFNGIVTALEQMLPDCDFIKSRHLRHSDEHISA